MSDIARVFFFFSVQLKRRVKTKLGIKDSEWMMLVRCLLITSYRSLRCAQLRVFSINRTVNIEHVSWK